MSGNYEIYQKQYNVETIWIFLHVIKFDKHALTPCSELSFPPMVCVFSIISKFLMFSVHGQHLLLIRDQRHELAFLLIFHGLR